MRGHNIIFREKSRKMIAELSLKFTLPGSVEIVSPVRTEEKYPPPSSPFSSLLIFLMGVNSAKKRICSCRSNSRRF